MVRTFFLYIDTYIYVTYVQVCTYTPVSTTVLYPFHFCRNAAGISSGDRRRLWKGGSRLAAAAKQCNANAMQLRMRMGVHIYACACRGGCGSEMPDRQGDNLQICALVQKPRLSLEHRWRSRVRERAVEGTCGYRQEGTLPSTQHLYST